MCGDAQAAKREREAVAAALEEAKQVAASELAAAVEDATKQAFDEAAVAQRHALAGAALEAKQVAEAVAAAALEQQERAIRAAVRARDDERAEETAAAIRTAVQVQVDAACMRAVEEARLAWAAAEEERFSSMAHLQAVEKERFAHDLQAAATGAEERTRAAERAKHAVELAEAVSAAVAKAEGDAAVAAAAEQRDIEIRAASEATKQAEAGLPAMLEQKLIAERQVMRAAAVSQLEEQRTQLKAEFDRTLKEALAEQESRHQYQARLAREEANAAAAAEGRRRAAHGSNEAARFDAAIDAPLTAASKPAGPVPPANDDDAPTARPLIGGDGPPTASDLADAALAAAVSSRQPQPREAPRGTNGSERPPPSRGRDPTKAPPPRNGKAGSRQDEEEYSDEYTDDDDEYTDEDEEDDDAETTLKLSAKSSRVAGPTSTKAAAGAAHANVRQAPARGRPVAQRAPPPPAGGGPVPRAGGGGGAAAAPPAKQSGLMAILGLD